MNKILIFLTLFLGHLYAQPLFHNDSVRCYEKIDGRFEHFYTGFFEYRPDGKILVDSTLFYEEGHPADYITEIFDYDLRGRQFKNINRYGAQNGELKGFIIDSGYYVSDNLFYSITTQNESPDFVSDTIEKSTSYFTNEILDSVVGYSFYTESFYKIEYTYYLNKFPKTIKHYFKKDFIDNWHLVEKNDIYEDALGKLTFSADTLYSDTPGEPISIYKFEFTYSNNNVIKIDFFERDNDIWNYKQYCDLYYKESSLVQNLNSKKSSKIFKFHENLILNTTEDVVFPLQWKVYDLQGKQIYSEFTNEKLLNISKLNSTGLLNVNVIDKFGKIFQSKFIQH